MWKIRTFFVLVSVIPVLSLAQPSVNTTMKDFFMPGSQPGESGTVDGLNISTDCGCHSYNTDVEPIFNWEGSMMAQATRDLIFDATMTIANQDADSSGDLCLRCHTATAWLSGRSIPTDGSALVEGTSDYTGVNCLVCHLAIKPRDLWSDNPWPTDNDYTGTPSSNKGVVTYEADTSYLYTIRDHIPPTTANGMYVISFGNETTYLRRGPFFDSNAKHPFAYSPFHLESSICGTCHDVSNPTLSRGGYSVDYALNNLDENAPSFDPYDIFPVERTYSEWLMSSYNSPGGISGTNFGGNKTSVSSCQDCHMKWVTGKAANSGTDRGDSLALHDLTGGNTFMQSYLKYKYPSDVNADALDSGVVRATSMLQNAATLEVTAYTDIVTVKVTNETGHKLPSGYPEGRRMWIQVVAWNAAHDTLFVSGDYDNATGVLTEDSQVKIYQIKPGLSYDQASAAGLTAGHSFHFVLNDTIFDDNRIPPRGFTNTNFDTIQSPPVNYTYNDGEYWDETNYLLPETPDSVQVTLYYQSTSKEYVEFLRDENVTDDKGDSIWTYWNNYGKSSPVQMARINLGSDDISLPVHMQGLTAKYMDGNVHLHWITQSEIDNLGFIILRSSEVDGNETEIAHYQDYPELEGAGTSSLAKEYDFVDETIPVLGMKYFYKIQEVSYSGKIKNAGFITVSAFDQDKLPSTFSLGQNYPNPFNPTTIIPFTVEKKRLVELVIYNVRGQEVRRFSPKLYFPGVYNISWDGRNNYGVKVGSGVYVYQLKSLNTKMTKKLVLVR